jgi:hypothetical protein
MPLLHEVFNRRIHRDVERKQGKPEIGADGKILALVVNDEAFPLAFALADDRHGFLHHAERVGVDRVHLRGEFEAEDAVADIPE